MHDPIKDCTNKQLAARSFEHKSERYSLSSTTADSTRHTSGVSSAVQVGLLNRAELGAI
jgi:hypothetical protein